MLNRICHCLFPDTDFTTSSASVVFAPVRLLLAAGGAEDLCACGLIAARANTPRRGGAGVSGGGLNRYPMRPFRSSIFSISASSCAAGFSLENELKTPPKSDPSGFLCFSVPFAFFIFSGEAIVAPNHDFFTGVCNLPSLDFSVLGGDDEYVKAPNRDFFAGFDSAESFVGLIAGGGGADLCALGRNSDLSRPCSTFASSVSADSLTISSCIFFCGLPAPPLAVAAAD